MHVVMDVWYCTYFLNYVWYVYFLVLYSEQVPCGGPPSFSGRLAKYSYKLTIGAQKPNCAAKIMRLPFRVMVIPGESNLI